MYLKTIKRAAIAAATLSLMISSPGAAQEGTPATPAEQSRQIGPTISGDFPFESHFLEVKGSRMHYVDVGTGDPILFIHGNPTSSYLWRNIIPYAVPHGRAIAVDLIGMGKSDQPDLDYRFKTHAAYLEEFINKLDLTNITLVIHDWGSALGMDFARRHPNRVKAIAFMEAIIPPAFPQPSYEAMGQGVGEFFRSIKTEGVGEKMILEDNMFVEVVLPRMATLRTLSEQERQVYRTPYPTPQSRIPTLVWPREIPIGGEPADVTKIVLANDGWLKETDIPKIMFYADPGSLGGPQVAAYMSKTLKNIETLYVGPGIHFIQEDRPHEIGRGLADWLRRHK